MTKIQLYSHLGKRFGRIHKRDIGSPAEAIRALSSTLPGFRDYIRDTLSDGYRIIVGDEELDADQLFTPVGRQTVKIVPVVAGAKNELVQIIIGAVAIAVVYGTGGMAGAGFSFTGTSALSTATISMGSMMILGGIAQMMASAPDPSAYNLSNGKESYIFGGADTATQAGGPVPVLFGKLEIPGVLISGGIVPEPMAASHFGLLGDGTGAWSGDGLTTPYAASIKV